MIKPKSLGHLVLKVRDLNRSEKFYTQILGLQVMGRLNNKMVFLSAGEKHHDLALFKLQGDAVDAQKMQVGLLHFAWELETLSDLKQAYSFLKKEGIPIQNAIEHGISKGIYFLDPDGNEVEVYCDNPKEEWQRLENPFGGSAPVNLES